MFQLGEEVLTHTSVYKLLGSPGLVAGYLSGGRYKNITLDIAKQLVQRRLDDLYLGVQKYLNQEDIELSFKNEESYNWWNNVIDNVKIVEITEERGYIGYQREHVSTGYYGIIIFPLPPKYIFEDL